MALFTSVWGPPSHARNLGNGTFDVEPPINEGWDLTMVKIADGYADPANAPLLQWYEDRRSRGRQGRQGSGPSSGLVNRFKLEAKIYPQHTLHTTSRSDPARGLEKEIVTTWSRIKEIGVGNCGSVWLESDLTGSQIFERAVKRIPKWIYTRNKTDYKREIAAMAVLSKYEQNFVQFYGWYESLEDIYLAMEYFPLGDLERYMDRQLSKFQIKVIIRQLLKGLCIMHQDEFTHRDLKPKNIFVVKDSPYFWVKIGDFGITKRVPHDGTSLKTETGTLGYVAPEVLGYHDQESSKYTNAVDLWSLGCICHRLLTMQAPFENPATMIRYCSGVTKLPIETLRRDDDDAVAFVKKLLMVSPSERYTAERALQSTWLKSNHPRGPLHLAPCQSHYQDEMPCEDEAFSGGILEQPEPLGKPLSDAHKPVHWLLEKARDYIKDVAVVMDWSSPSNWINVLKIGVLGGLLSIGLIDVYGLLFPNSGVLEPMFLGGKYLMVVALALLTGLKFR